MALLHPCHPLSCIRMPCIDDLPFKAHANAATSLHYAAQESPSGPGTPVSNLPKASNPTPQHASQT